jgi:hypothetical protein
MHKNIGFFVTLGGVIFLVLVSSMLGGQKKAVAEPLAYSFTYTSAETVMICAVWDTIRFESQLENTGQADSYYVTCTENPITPSEWWVQFCIGGCVDSTVTQGTIGLDSAENTMIFVDVIPRSVGYGKFTVQVQSQGNPGLIKTKIFLLSANVYGPVTNEWGMIILILLLLASATYLMWRRLKPVSQT